jgi:acetyl-CoA acyltransferase
MRDAVIVSAVRSPLGKRRGLLSEIHSADLSATVLNDALTRVGLEPSHVEDVVWRSVTQIGEQSTNVGRTAVLAAGWPETVPATTVDRQCGSSQQAVHFAAAGLVSG